MCNAFMEDTCACAKLLRYISPGPSSVLIFSKQCTGKQEQNLFFSLSLNKILFHTWVLLCPRINLFYFVVWQPKIVLGDIRI